MERKAELASDSILCLFENRPKVGVGFSTWVLCIFKETLTELILDFDATNGQVYGSLQSLHFHGSTAGAFCPL